MKKVKVKKRIKIKSIIIALICILIVGLIVYYLLESHIKNIYVSGNNLVSEQKIIDLANLRYYPKRRKINTRKIEERLLEHPLIEKVDVSLKLNNKLYIDIVENKPLFYDEVHKEVIISNGDRMDGDYIGLPILTNLVDEEIYNRFIKAFNKVNSDVLNKISEIKYEPTELDKDRFLLFMNDQIYVYITLTKIDSLNKYNEIVDSLDDKKGILYLDSGNHFQIKDNGEKVEVTTE